ncbi:MAG TPA: PAS domain-containing protein [Terriglobales bacterium]|nr:PAS domain-containing protein [Terriglobales bacterium]
MTEITLPVGVPRSVLERSKAVICVLDSELRITYCNPAWDQFARQNAGHEVLATGVVGSLLLEVVAEPLKIFYQGIFAQAQATGQVQEFDYECSSAEVYRTFHMQVLPLKEQQGFLVMHSLRVEKPLDFRPPQAPDEGRYIGPNGFIVMCCHCRRTRRAKDLHAWDWVPAYLERRSQVSHGLCSVCYAYFYPGVFQDVEAD